MGKASTNASLSTLERRDGSATYSHHGYIIIAAVNGPIEVQRRDELPEEAVVDVTVRPAAGIGGTLFLDYNLEPNLGHPLGVRERHLESLIQRALRRVILVAAHPRTLIQIILQIVATQEDDDASSVVHQSASVRCSVLVPQTAFTHPYNQMIAVIPALLQASMLALLSSSIPLTMVLISISVAVDRRGNLIYDPPAGATQSAASLHVLVFSSTRDLLLAESEGKFSVDTWENAFEMARSRCRSTSMDADVDVVNMESRLKLDMEGSFKFAAQKEFLKKERWKKSLD